MAAEDYQLSPEVLEELGVKKAKMFPGRPWEDLSDEEKKAIYADYEGNQKQIDFQMELAEQLLGSTGSGLIGTERMQTADWGGALSDALRSMAGGVMGYRAKKAQDALGKQRAMGRAALGDLGAHNEARLIDAITKQKQAASAQAKATAPAPGTPVPTPQITSGTAQMPPAQPQPQPASQGPSAVASDVLSGRNNFAGSLNYTGGPQMPPARPEITGPGYHDLDWQRTQKASKHKRDLEEMLMALTGRNY